MSLQASLRDNLPGHGPKPRRTRRARPGIETMEGRALPSVGGAIVIAKPIGLQMLSASASSNNGSSVAVWLEEAVVTSSRTTYDVKLQRFNSQGSKVGGVLNLGSTTVAAKPAVGMDGSGNIFIGWTIARSGQTDINLVRYTASGSLDWKYANTYIANSSSSESDPILAVTPSGTFVASYTLASGSNKNVLAKQFDSQGKLLRTISVATTSLEERFSSIAVAPDGRFDVAYQQNASNGSNPDIYLKRYSATGVLLGTSSIATSSRAEWYPQVAMDNTTPTPSWSGTRSTATATCSPGR